MAGTNDSQEPLVEIQRTILEIVREGQLKRPAGVHLPYVGGEFAKKKAVSFEKYLSVLVVTKGISLPPSERKLLPFIDKHMGGELQVERDPVRGDTVRLIGEDVQQEAPLATNIPSSYKFKRAVWAAFVRILPDGQRRFLNVGELVFVDEEQKPDEPGWQEIKKKYIAGVAFGGEINGPLVQANITQWAHDCNVDFNQLVIPDEDTKGPSVAELIAIIRCLPPEVSARWTIPADIFRHLKLR